MINLERDESAEALGANVSRNIDTIGVKMADEISAVSESNKVVANSFSKALVFNSPFVREKIVNMSKLCFKPWHFACLMAVLDDHGLLKDRCDYIDYARMLQSLGYQTKREAKKFANSIRYTMSKLPTKYKSWEMKLRRQKLFCVNLAMYLDPSTPYRYEVRTATC
ncbi:MAG: hypothetical protein J5663_10715 [Bacteroidaceae bacterium]|nr:hypothetical protein [Bacteroidaceae bacterium]